MPLLRSALRACFLTLVASSSFFTAFACNERSSQKELDTPSETTTKPGHPESKELPEPEKTSETKLKRPWSDATLVELSEPYLHDRKLRRAVLLDSLTSKKNIYARTRITSYGLDDEGWEMLPSWSPKSETIANSHLQSIRKGQTLTLQSTQSFWDGSTPTSMEEWIALGKKVFFLYPLRSEEFAEHAMRSASAQKAAGLTPAKDGSWPGFVAFENLQGEVEVGITCAVCHVAVVDGEVVEGQARRSFDYGKMRVAFYEETRTPIEAKLKARMQSWGPGRADITQDESEDPVAIVDLWNLRDHRFLTQSGTITHNHPIALAIRQETQIIHANHERIRPPRVLTWALSMYLYSLRAPKNKSQSSLSHTLSPGKLLFSEHCQHCHSDASGAGLLVAVDKVGTDSALSKGIARGTGFYRPSPLIALDRAAPYFHDGSLTRLDLLLEKRKSPAGHDFGIELSKSEKSELLGYLRSL